MTTSMLPTYEEIFERVMKELCELVGFDDHSMLVAAGKLRIDDYTVSFMMDPEYLPDNVFVYIDMGPCMNTGDTESVYKSLLKINFELLAGSRGAISIHPHTDHIFYSFRYALNEAANGRDLLDSLIRFIGNVGVEAIEASKPKTPPGTEIKAGHLKMSRLIEGLDKREKN